MTSLYHIGDTRAVLRTLPAGSVDLIVSSPPFLALRSYLPADHPDKPYEIGSESTPGEFLDVLLDVVEECARVLAPHGSLCFELGDTYAGSGGAGGDYGSGGLREGQGKFDGSGRRNRPADVAAGILPPRGRPGPEQRDHVDGWPLAKSLCLIPQSFAFALSYGRNPHTGRTTDPWRVRNIVRWWRPNPPVGALGDKWRPATSEITVACKSAKRYWDDIATRTEYAESTIKQHGPQAVERRGGRGSSNGDKSATTRAMAEGALTQPGAPLQDTWRIPTAPYVTPSGLIVPAGGTVHQVRVPVGVGGDGIQRTTSPDCPMHGSQGHSGPTHEHGERAADASNHIERNDARLDPSLADGSQPTPLPNDLTGSAVGVDGHAARTRSTLSSKTGRAHATNLPGIASEETIGRTDDTQASLSSAETHPDTRGNRTSAGGSYDAPSARTHDDTADTCSCTCSYWIELTVASESTSNYAGNPDTWKIPTHGFKGSHYATYPPALVEPLVKAMAPPRVCRVCGEPSRRIVEHERTFADDYRPDAPSAGRSAAAQQGGPLAHWSEYEVTRETVGWTDCGHNTWRRARILDPFAGTGTTLMVAQGHGHDTIGIDLDARNADLARERLGMFLEVVA